jgi:hypothetical protein
MSPRALTAILTLSSSSSREAIVLRVSIVVVVGGVDGE